MADLQVVFRTAGAPRRAVSTLVAVGHLLTAFCFHLAKKRFVARGFKIDCFHDSPGSRVVQRPIDLLHEKKSNISTLTGQQGWRKEKGEPLGLLLARPDAMQGKKLPPGAMQR